MHPDEDVLTFQRFMLAFDTPAYLRRAQQVTGEWTHLVAVCRRERERLLDMPRLRLAQLWMSVHAAGLWGCACAPPETWDMLARLHVEWTPPLRLPVPPARSLADAATRLAATRDAFRRFNVRWRAYLAQVDLAHVNESRERYNRYYVLEKECAVRSSRTARDGFEPLPPVTAADLLEELPPLPEV